MTGLPIVRIGAIHIDADGLVYGPTDFMEAVGDDLMDRCEAGDDPIYECSLDDFPDSITALVARLSAACSAWRLWEAERTGEMPAGRDAALGRIAGRLAGENGAEGD